MADFQLRQSGQQVQNDLNLLDNNSATSGQVLSADGSGGCAWQDYLGAVRLFKGFPAIINIQSTGFTITWESIFANDNITATYGHVGIRGGIILHINNPSDIDFTVNITTNGRCFIGHKAYGGILEPNVTINCGGSYEGPSDVFIVPLNPENYGGYDAFSVTVVGTED